LGVVAPHVVRRKPRDLILDVRMDVPVCLTLEPSEVEP